MPIKIKIKIAYADCKLAPMTSTTLFKFPSHDSLEDLDASHNEPPDFPIVRI